jgi:lipoyl(octanoyl) transferase
MNRDALESSCSSSLAQSDSSRIVIIEEPVSYQAAWDLQSRLHEKIVQGLRDETVLILEHQSVYTLGRSAQASHWGGSAARLRETGADVHAANRGGSVTYHGPGQIVIYPILRLRQHAAGPRRFVWLMEEVLLRLLERWQLVGHRLAHKPGVWLTVPLPAKIASIGVRVEHGVTLHGAALNVDMDLTPFDLIQPCGVADCLITSMAARLSPPPPVQTMKRDLAAVFRQVLSVDWPVLELPSYRALSDCSQTNATRDYARA